MTELHEWDDYGRITSVNLCRAPFRVSHMNATGDQARTVWICTNERCGTALIEPLRG